MRVLGAFFLLGFAWSLVWAQPGFAQDERFWITREVISHGVDNCRDGQCPKESEYTTRHMHSTDPGTLRRMIDLLEQRAVESGQPVPHPESPVFCAAQLPDPDLTIWNPEWMQVSHKLEALRGLEAIHVDVSGLKPPDGYEGDFGPALQADLEAKFAAAGIKIVSKEEMEKVPGQPKLQVFFSHTNPDTGCWWSVFATMTQTALLTRDISVKISAGTWAFMAGYDPDNLERTEFQAISQVFDSFVADYIAANAEDFEPVNVAPYRDLWGNPMTLPEVSVMPYADLQKLLPEGDPLPEPEPELDYVPGSRKPELSPKALRRLAAQQRELDKLAGTAADAEALEKLTVTGGEN